MIATPEMLAALNPGEWLMRCLRDGWTIPPDHIAIAKANAALRAFKLRPREYARKSPNSNQRKCLEGTP